MADFHMGGLSSGYDIEGIITKMLEVKAVPMKAWVANQEEVDADVAAWSDISTYMSDLTDSLDKLRTWETWNQKSTSVSDPTAFSAVAASGATASSYRIAITTLARAHSVASNHIAPLIPATATFSDQASATTGSASMAMLGDGSSVSTGSWKATYDGVGTWSVVNTTTGSLVGTVSAAPGAGGTLNIENASGNGFSLTIDPPSVGTYNATDEFTWSNSKRTSTTDLVGAGVLTAGETFTLEGQTITIGATESMVTLQSKINLASSAMNAAQRVRATIIDNRLVIERVNTGSTAITMSDSSGTPLQDLGIVTGGGAYANVFVTPADAVFSVNGAAITRSKNTGLTDVIQNVTLNLLDETLGTETLTVENDRESVRTAILDFVDKYNASAAVLKDAGNVGVTGSATTGAVVDEESMGELYNDTLVASIAANMRKQATASKQPALNVTNASYTYNGRTGIMDSLDDIGISTEGRENKLSLLDEDRLDTMLENNFDQVAQLFRGVYNETNGYQNGIASDFYKYANNVSEPLTGEIARRTTRLNEQSTDLGTQISDMDASLKVQEQLLWERFTAMEDAISKFQSKLAALQSSGLTSSSSS